MDEVKVIQAIYCTKKRRGDGKSKSSPIRIVTEIFTLDGELIAEKDPEIRVSTKDLFNFFMFAQTTDDKVFEKVYDKWQQIPKP